MTRSSNPKRGEVWWIDFDPSVGTEVQKRRPAIIVSNDVANRYLSRVTVVPLTSNTEKVYPAQTVVTMPEQSSKAMADQLQTASIQRVHNRICKLSASDMANVEDAIRVHLGL